MPELLLEVGCEELPASFVRKAASDLRESLTAALRDAGVLQSEGSDFGTPRRLIVSFPEISPRQEDATKEQRGPGLKAAYDADGKPTPALLGFCRSQGVAPEDLRRDDQYVWVTKEVEGRQTRDLLSEILPKAILALNFEKSMRWGSSRFARPIRWLLAVFDREVVPFQIETAVSDRRSRGHRFYAPDSFEAGTLAELLEGLRARSVEPDPALRRARIFEGAGRIASGEPELTESLVDENVYLTEWPSVLQGEFREEFRLLPAAVLVTAMAKHEKMFPVRERGELTNRFLFVRNSGEDNTVRAGNEWVLNARFNDAKFFFDEDARSTMDDFLAKTEGIVFGDRLGSVRQRAERLSSLSEAVARATGADETEAGYARDAGLYAKADLSTGLVSELPSLQGVVGGEYARKQGWSEPVCFAIASHYDLAEIGTPDTPQSRTAVRVAVAEALDKLAGYLGLGLGPTGSSDPFALRRAATTLIEAAWAWPGPFPAYKELIAFALDAYEAQGMELNRPAVLPALSELFAARYGALMPEVRYDILDAALLKGDMEEMTLPRQVRLRVGILTELAGDIPFVQTATRPLNILIAARKKGIEYGESDPLHRVEHSALESADGLDLLQTLSEGEAEMDRAVREEDAASVIRLLRRLADPINRFFDSTMVMADQPDVRYARLTLLEGASQQLLRAGDFSRLVIEG